MMRFREWQEEKFKKELVHDLEMGLRNGMYIHDPTYHKNIVKKLRIIGLGDDADELEMIRPSEKDMDFYRPKPMSSITFSPEYNLKKTWMDAKLARETYESHVKNLIEKIKGRIGG